MSQDPKDILGRGAPLMPDPEARLDALAVERSEELGCGYDAARTHLVRALILSPKSMDELQPYTEAERREAKGLDPGVRVLGDPHPLTPFVENPDEALCMVVGAKCPECGREGKNARLRMPDGTVRIQPLPFGGPFRKWRKPIPCRACGSQMFLELEPVPEGVEMVSIEGVSGTFTTVEPIVRRTAGGGIG